MNVWMLNHYALTPSMSGGTRHYDLGKELVAKGHKVTIVASSFHYSKFVEMREYGDKESLEEDVNGVKFIWLKTRPYAGNGIGRVLNMLSYMKSAIKTLSSKNVKKPDIIIGSSVHMFAVYAGYRLAKRYNVPFVMEVRDIWPKTLVDMGISKWHPFVILLGVMESFLYKKSDKILTNLPYAYEHIEQYVDRDKVVWISNGVDMDNIKYTPKEKSDKFVISYTGAIGTANNLQILLEVAKRLKGHEDIYFQIVGDGPEKPSLLRYKEEHELSKVNILDSVAKDKVSDILANSDVLFFNLKDSPIFQFGISSNKLFDYMASGRIIIFSSNAKNNPIKDSQSGFSIEPDNIEALEETILKIYKMPLEERVSMGLKARDYVEKNFSTKVLGDKLENFLKELVDSKNTK